MVREFSLLNEKNQKFSLMDIENYCLLTAPSGLGMAYDTEYERLNNIFVTKLRNLQQGSITGTLNFKGYENYKKFIDFVEYAESLKQRKVQVVIGGAGGAAHLPGIFAAMVPAPVIGVPIHTKTLSGVDSLYSIVQMPSGIPVATVGIAPELLQLIEKLFVSTPEMVPVL